VAATEHDIDLLAEGKLREQAVALLDDFIKTDGCPVSASQVNCLRELAAARPLTVKRLATHQRERAQRRGPKSAAEAEFWTFLEEVCEGRKRWSLLQQAEALLTDEEKQGKKKREHTDEALRRLAPPFFQCFCAHYLYRMGTKTAGGR
jgi:hypothetical protein